MDRFVEDIKRLWNLRKSSDKAIRVRWWLAAIGLIGLILFHNYAYGYLLTIWVCYNVSIGVTSFAWMLLHPRSLGASSSTAIVWSRWLSVAAAVMLYLNLQSGHSRMTPGMLLIIAIASAPLAFVCFLMFSLFGASVGAFVKRKSQNIEQSAIAAVAGWWIAVILIVSVLESTQRLPLPDSIAAALMLGAPSFTILFGSLVQKTLLSRSHAPIRLIDAGLRRLVFTREKDGQFHTTDLRGIAIGLLTAVGMLSIGSGMLDAARQSALMSMFRLRAQIVSSIPTEANPISPVLLAKLDAASRAEAVTTGSEAAVQAEMIRRLHQAGAACVVLPMPTLGASSSDAGDTDQKAVAQTVRDIPDLAAAMKQNGKVLLVASRLQQSSPLAVPLIAAAAGVGQFGVETFGPGQLSTVPLAYTGDAPIPLLAMAVKQGLKLKIHPVPDSADYAEVGGEKVALALPGRAVFDFRTTVAVGSTFLLHKEALLTATYSTLLNDKSKDVVANRTVFLEPLVEPGVETPVGVMPSYELLATVTNALITDGEVKPGSKPATIVWTLLIGILIGGFCVGRDPLQSSWRVALIMLLTVAYCLWDYLVTNVWSDPVVPLATAAIAYLLVTQLTFALERDERDRNRALFSRFVAREFVDEMLQSSSMKLALGGQKRTVCVLFADVRNFTGFAESHRPEEVIEIMNIYLTALTNALDSYGGLLDKYTGDGLMAFFEIKGDLQQELIRSVNASLAMRDAAIQVSEQLRLAGKKTLEIGIGMHFGEAIVGLVGNAERQINYTALGHTVVVSARLQTLAEGGDVVVSETIYDEVRDHFSFQSIPPVFVKGISTEMRPYQVGRAETLVEIPPLI